MMGLETVVKELLGAIPAANGAVSELREQWEGDPPVTLLTSTIGESYVREADRTSEAAKIRFFAIVDEAMDSDDDLVRDAIATGLLEAVVSEVERRGGDRVAIFEKYAQPRALRYIRAWDDFTSTPRPPKY